MRSIIQVSSKRVDHNPIFTFSQIGCITIVRIFVPKRKTILKSYREVPTSSHLRLSIGTPLYCTSPTVYGYTVVSESPFGGWQVTIRICRTAKTSSITFSVRWPKGVLLALLTLPIPSHRILPIDWYERSDQRGYAGFFQQLLSVPWLSRFSPQFLPSQKVLLPGRCKLPTSAYLVLSISTVL